MKIKIIIVSSRLVQICDKLACIRHQLTEVMATLNAEDGPSCRALIIVDMSVEQVQDLPVDRTAVVSNCSQLARSRFFGLIIDCRLWLRSAEESSLSWVYPETAKTLFLEDSEGASLIPELRDISSLVFVPKNNYSCFANTSLLSKLQSAKISEVYVCGINTDYCVFATALDSFQYKFRTRVVQDAVTSVRGRIAHKEGLANLERHMGKILVDTKNIVNSK